LELLNVVNIRRVRLANRNLKRMEMTIGIAVDKIDQCLLPVDQVKHNIPALTSSLHDIKRRAPDGYAAT
jgi:hypothetical protein